MLVGKEHALNHLCAIFICLCSHRRLAARYCLEVRLIFRGRGGRVIIEYVLSFLFFVQRWLCLRSIAGLAGDRGYFLVVVQWRLCSGIDRIFILRLILRYAFIDRLIIIIVSIVSLPEHSILRYWYLILWCQVPRPIKPTFVEIILFLFLRLLALVHSTWQMLPATTFEEVSWLHFSFLRLLLFNLLTKRLGELLFYQLLEIFFCTSERSVIVQHLAISCSLAGVRIYACFDCFLRVLLVEFKVCLAHALNRPIIIFILPLDIFSFHAANRLFIEISNWLFGCLPCFDRPFDEVYVDALIFFYGIKIHRWPSTWIGADIFDVSWLDRLLLESSLFRFRLDWCCLTLHIQIIRSHLFLRLVLQERIGRQFLGLLLIDFLLAGALKLISFVIIVPGLFQTGRVSKGGIVRVSLVGTKIVISCWWFGLAGLGVELLHAFEEGRIVETGLHEAVKLGVR